ncbi:hypothetical protein [Comamonas testosteroni]|uniref:hypothetical protein n=1 Tax=Comamonas testosteroni TaxID=285 RepID=UPI00391D7862
MGNGPDMLCQAASQYKKSPPHCKAWAALEGSGRLQADGARCARPARQTGRRAVGMPALALVGTMSAIPVLRQMRNMLTWRSPPRGV